MTHAPRTTRVPRWALPLALSALVVGWQLSFLSVPVQPRVRWAMSASMGLCADAPHFFYFYHHLGQFPVGALETPQLGPGRADALAFVAKHGDRLRMDFGGPTNTPRFGDYGKLWLFEPDVWLRHDPAHPSLLPFNMLLFVAALLSVLWAFWLEGHALLGVLLVLFVGSDPFQLVETYGRGNVFSLPVSVTLLALAGHVRLLAGRGAGRGAWVLAAVSGVALACVREVRAEAGLVGLSLLALYALVPNTPWRRRALLVAAFLVTGALAGRGWQAYWDGRFAEARRFVAAAGGQVCDAPYGTHHAFWHAAYCGLGDFGGDRGFEWSDQGAFRWATTYDPATNPHPLAMHYSGGFYFDETYDGVNHVAPTDVPAYNALVRGRVTGEIARHPLWYARILGQRVLAVLGDAVPAGIAAGRWTLALPGAGWLAPLLFAAFVWRRRRFEAALVAFVLPLSLLPVMIYSGRGMTFYGIAHLVALAAGIAWWAGARGGASRERTSDG